MAEPDAPLRSRSVGLVLGAGGVTGYAFHTGALAALAEIGWDARSAALIVGTSAGAGVATLLRAGLSPEDNYAHALGTPVSSAGEALFARVPPGAWNSGERADGGLPLPAAPTMALRGLLRWPVRPGLAVAGALPRGRRSSTPMGDRYRALHADWPSEPLWLCAVRMDGRRVVFGRDDHPPLDVGLAVQASSAIPGYFQPVRVGGHHYVDGGVWSTTNADLLTGLGFDAVVVLAPLSAAQPPAIPAGAQLLAARGVDAATRTYHRRVLRSETHRVRHAGSPVISIEPTPEDLLKMNGPDTGDGRRPDIAQVAYQSVLLRFERDPALRALLTETITR